LAEQLGVSTLKRFFFCWTIFILKVLRLVTNRRSEESFRLKGVFHLEKAFGRLGLNYRIEVAEAGAA